jgi:C4-dicarboxylate-specific signal transduction histidine kinase
MKRDWSTKLWHSSRQYILGGIGLALVTFVGVRFGLDIHEAGFLYLIVIAVLSQMGSFGSVVLSIVAVGCLYYFFASPLFSFSVEHLDDVLALAAFLTTSTIVAGLVALARRMWEEAQASQKALRESEKYLAEAQRVSHAGSFGWSVASGELIWSEETYRIFECDRAVKPTLELVLQRVHPDDLVLVQRTIDRAASSVKDFDFEHRLLMPDGSVKYVRVAAHAVRDQVDRFDFIGAAMDVTAAKRAEEALHKAQAELAHVTRVTTLWELTASIAHEVNQPLAGLVSSANACSNWLASQPPNIEKARQSVDRIIEDGIRASEVIRRLRALSSKTETQKVPLYINDVVNEVFALVRHELTNHRVSLRMELAPAPPMVLADRVQLQQVIINLVINGIEAMRSVTDRPRELLIRSKHDAHEVLVTVQDCGVGISTKNADRLFNAFFTTKSSGMGMGLSICLSIIEAHGGRMSAANNAGPGATFQFTLAIASKE